MLMALLPLAGWAETETIALQPYVLTKTYGTADASVTITSADFKIEENVTTSLTKAAVAEALNTAGGIIRVNSIAGTEAGEAAGNSYSYRYPSTIEVSGTTYNVVTSQNGTLNIVKGQVEITDLDLIGWSYGNDANDPTVSSAVVGTEDVASEITYTYAVQGESTYGTYAEIVNGQAGDYTVKATVEDTDNYDGTEETANFTISKKDITPPAFAATTYSITYGEDAPAWGLAFTEGDLVNEADADEFAVVKQGDTSLPTGASATAYTVAIVDNSGNYSFTSGTAQYTINFKAINAEGIAIKNANALPSKTYKASAWELTTTDTGSGDDLVEAELQVWDGETRLVSGTDYSVTYENNINAGTATVTITGAGNYNTSSADDKLTATFTIAEATLTAALTNVSQNIAYGGTWNAEVTLTGWQGSDADSFDAANNPVAAIPGEDDYDEANNLTPGEHTVTISGGTAPTNYVFAYNDEGTVTVGKAIVTIALKAGVTVEWNGTSTETDIFNALSDAYTITGAGTLTADQLFATQPTVISAAAVNANYAPASYAITFQSEDAVLKDAYTNNYQLAYSTDSQNFTISKKAMTITALNQAVAAVTNEADSDFDTTPAYGTTYTIDAFAAGESIDDNSVDLSGLTISKGSSANLTTAGEYTNGIEISSASSDYYEITYVAGDLTVTGDGGAITLAQNDEANGIIEAADGNTGVSVKFGARTMAAGQWYTVVLPFPTTPAELVEKLGTYVVVNRLGANSTADHVAFVLEMSTLPAGEAFLMKTADDLNWNGKTFSGKEVSTTIVAEAKGGNKLVGVYSTTAVQSTDDQKIAWLGNTTQTKADGSARENTWYEPYTAAKDIVPFEAYLMYAPGVTAAPVITVEDIDGSVTAISQVKAGEFQAVKADGWYTLNGVKLNAAPTEKGVYINNGKKVVIK